MKAAETGRRVCFWGRFLVIPCPVQRLIKNYSNQEFPLWHSGLRMWHCLCGGTGLIPSQAQRSKDLMWLPQGQRSTGAPQIWSLGQQLPYAASKVKTTNKPTKPLQQAKKGKMTEGSDLSGMKFWVTPPAKEPRAAEVLADSGELWDE